jgi:hypothetical protein
MQHYLREEMLEKLDKDRKMFVPLKSLIYAREKRCAWGKFEKD